jgi:hypothetical protein
LPTPQTQPAFNPAFFLSNQGMLNHNEQLLLNNNYMEINQQIYKMQEQFLSSNNQI